MDPIDSVKKLDGAPSSKSMELQKNHLVTYLTTNGVVEWLTKICVDLNLKRPDNPIEYLQNSLGNLSTAAMETIRTATTDDKETRIKELECELAEARLEIELLKQALSRKDAEKIVEEVPKEVKEIKEIKVENVVPKIEEPVVEIVEVKPPVEITPITTEEVKIATEPEKVPEAPVAADK